MTSARDVTTSPATAGYAKVNGLRMYYEIHGNESPNGNPLVVLHGGLMTIDSTFGAILPALAAGRQVIGVELQGHGHTADTERELTLDNLADDIADLLAERGIERADLFGFSLGGLTALRVAMRHPERVGRLVGASTHYRSDGYHPEIRNPQPGDSTDRMPTEEDFQQWQDAYTRVAPDPQQFFPLATKATPVPDEVNTWSEAEIESITAPTLLIIGDNDFVRLDHAGAMRDLIPGAQLAVLPGTTHMGVLQRSELLLLLVETFLSQKD